MTIKVFKARSVITLDSALAQADAVAVQDGRVLHTGMFDQVKADLSAHTLEIDDHFADSVIAPGFIEAHCHIQREGALSRYPWVGSYTRRRVDGSYQDGCSTAAAVIERLHAAHGEMKDSNESLIAVGFDQSMVNGEALTLQMLDSVSDSRPIWVMQSNGHVGHANSAMLARAGVDRTTDEEGVARDANGEPTGEIRELALALFLGKHVELDAGGEGAIWDAGHLSRQVGCTMVTDLAYIPTLKSVDAYGTIVNNELFPTRVRYAPNITFLSLRNDFDKTLALFKTLEQYNTDKFAMGPLKFIADGSIQGRTARMNWPGYCCGSPNGLWLGDPEKIYEQMLPFHEAGYQLALHTNGDEAIQAGLDIYQRLLEAHPRFDHRHRLEHVQMATDAMFRRIKTLGVCVNLFANHLYYWGDTHRNDTMGPAKARHLDAVGTAVRMGIPHSIHSDAPVTPLDPLFTMWCAVNRVTSSGHVLGEAERISPIDALRAMTIGSAYLLNCDDEYGSIEVGKHADFAVLGADPSAVDPMEIKDIEVVATVLGGQVHSNRN
jgi:hypothetical protein